MEHYHQIIPKESLEYFKNLPKKLGAFVTRTFLSPFPLNPPSSYEPSKVDEMLLGEDAGGRWTDMGTYYIERTETAQQGFNATGEYEERQV